MTDGGERGPSTRLRVILKGSYGLVQTFAVFILMVAAMSIFLPSFMTGLNLKANPISRSLLCSKSFRFPSFSSFSRTSTDSSSDPA